MSWAAARLLGLGESDVVGLGTLLARLYRDRFDPTAAGAMPLDAVGVILGVTGESRGPGLGASITFRLRGVDLGEPVPSSIRLGVTGAWRNGLETLGRDGDRGFLVNNEE